MTREPRHIEPGTAYHLISRFVDRDWFIQKAYEREHYLRLLGLSLENRWISRLLSHESVMQLSCRWSMLCVSPG